MIKYSKQLYNSLGGFFMKKSICFFIMICLISICSSVYANTTPDTDTLKLQIGNPYMTFNGVQTEIDPGRGTVPIVENGRTLVPIRAIIEALGGTVGWNGETNTITLNHNKDVIRLIIGSKKASFNGSESELDVAPATINERTMLPIRYIAESFKFSVKWDEVTSTVTIITKNQNMQNITDNEQLKVLNNLAKRTNQLFDYENNLPIKAYVWEPDRGIASNSTVFTVSIPVSVSEPTKVTVHREIYSSHFIVGTSTDENAGIGSPITNWTQYSSGTNWHTLTIDIDETIKSICITYSKSDTSAITYNPDDVLKTLMVQYGDTFTGYEPYITTPGLEMLKQHEADQHPRLSRLLQRQGLAWSHSEEYMRQIASEANRYTSPDKMTFLFVSDTHSNKDNTYISGIAANMTKYVPCSFIAHGGDIIDGVSKKENELMVLTDVNRNFLEASCPTFYVKGNHDDNCLFARGGVSAPIGLASDYITNNELYMRSNIFNKYITNSSVGMYSYYDDENTKIRSVFLNGFDNPETVDANGKRIEDARSKQVSEEQIAWLKSTALNFTDKTNKEEWAVVLFSHSATVFETGIQGLLNQFTTGTGDFAEQGAMEIIAFFHGDDHLDGLGAAEIGGKVLTRIVILNASQAQDNASVVTPERIWLMPPKKQPGTENETAFDLVTIDRENHLIYLTRYGARSYVYNEETGEYDTLASRTRVIDYKAVTYSCLISETSAETE